MPFEPGQSVLDGLRWIRANRDPSLAIRFSCINANACKECMMELDGKTVYACTARLEPREMTLAPLSNKRLVRDLVTEIAPPAERLPGKDEIAKPIRTSDMFQTRKEDLAVERTPIAFGDMRGWIEALRAQGELQEINAEVDWNIELGTIMRLAQGPGTGKALIFNNIKDYNKPRQPLPPHLRLLAQQLSAHRHDAGAAARHASARAGQDRPHHPDRRRSRPRSSTTGPVKENILKGDDIDLFDFPAPYWNRVDGGRYLQTYGGCVTRDPETGVMNVGVYRGMVADENHMPILMWRAQHIGHHVTAWQNGGAAEMPIAIAMGWEPSLAFTAGSPVPKGICEYDVIGAIRGAPVELVKCETHDLYVPASAEIVIEGFLGLDPKTYMMEGPYAEFTGYVAGDARAEADHPRHRHHPPQRSDPARHHRRLDAGQLLGERASPPRSCAPPPPGTCSTAPACPASPTCGARRCRPASICSSA